MSCKSILPLIALFASVACAQQPSTPSETNLVKQLESQPAAANPARANDAQKNAAAPADPKKPDKTTNNSPLGEVANSAPSEKVLPATALSNDQLLVQGKTIYVVSNSFFVKKEQLERGLLERKELNDWGFHIVQDPKHADLILSVRRAPFQNNFPFTFTDRASGIVVMGGTVNSLFGTVPGKIAGRLADHLKELYKKQ
jgi:hypothetical protein